MPVAPNPPDRPVPTPPREAVQRWRLVLARGPLGGDVGQREQLNAWEAALLGSGLPVAGRDAVPPKPRFALAAPLGASIPGDAELADLWLTERTPAWRVREAIATSLPPAFRLVEAYDVWPGAPALPGQVVASVYRATLAGEVEVAELREAAAGLLLARTLPRERPKGQGTVTYDLRPFLAELSVAAVVGRDGRPAPVLRMTLRHDPERGIGRPEEAIGALREALGAPFEVSALVRESLVLAPPPVPALSPPRGRRQPSSSASRPRK